MGILIPEGEDPPLVQITTDDVTDGVNEVGGGGDGTVFATALLWTVAWHGLGHDRLLGRTVVPEIPGHESGLDLSRFLSVLQLSKNRFSNRIRMITKQQYSQPQ